MSNISKKLKQIGEVLRPVVWDLSAGAIFGLLVYGIFGVVLAIPIIIIMTKISFGVGIILCFLNMCILHLLGIAFSALHMIAEWHFRNRAAYCERVTAGRYQSINPAYFYIAMFTFGWCYAGHAIANPVFTQPEKNEPPLPIRAPEQEEQGK